MGLLVGGHRQDRWHENRDGWFECQDSLFRN